MDNRNKGKEEHRKNVREKFSETNERARQELKDLDEAASTRGPAQTDKRDLNPK